RLAGDYSRRIPVPRIAQHVRMAAALTPDHLSECAVSELRDGHFELTVVAYDYFADCEPICALLSAFALNIEEGQIYTFSEAAVSSPPTKSAYGERPRQRLKLRRGLSRKKIVDVFRVQPVGNASFTPDDQVRFAGELRSLIGLLDEGKFEDARHAGKRHLVDNRVKRRGSFSALLHPVQIAFDNSQSATDTIMDIRSDDTPAFLYAFANALAMRNVYVSQARIDLDGGKLH